MFKHKNNNKSFRERELNKKIRTKVVKVIIKSEILKRKKITQSHHDISYFM